MPLRYRKIISLGKLFRLNLSKGGVSISAGKPGASINISKQGMATNVGAPGTGLSYRSQIAQSKTSKNSNTSNMIIGIVAVAIVVCCLCVFGIYLINYFNETATPTATATMITRSTIIPISTDVEMTKTPFQCDCSGNIYNCSDFSTQQQAQSCFNYCLSQGVGDIHELDQNANGIACE